MRVPYQLVLLLQRMQVQIVSCSGSFHQKILRQTGKLLFGSVVDLAVAPFQEYSKRAGPLSGNPEHTSPFPILTAGTSSRMWSTSTSLLELGFQKETSQSVMRSMSLITIWDSGKTSSILFLSRVTRYTSPVSAQFIPYISNSMLDNGNKTYFNVSGVYISDPAINYPETLREVPVVPILEKYKSVLGLDESIVTGFRARADSCGYTNYYN